MQMDGCMPLEKMYLSRGRTKAQAAHLPSPPSPPPALPIIETCNLCFGGFMSSGVFPGSLPFSPSLCVELPAQLGRSIITFVNSLVRQLLAHAWLYWIRLHLIL
uniref:Uncharacterized protein n=1 Tax=Bionectria ochroleuca TaxID=29856 RepID=A0A8H7TN41_BIOOC